MRTATRFRTLVAIAALTAPFWGSPLQEKTSPDKAVQGDKTKAPKKKAKAPPAPDPVAPGPPVTVEYLTQMIDRVKAGIMPEARVLAVIDKRGLAFTATEENLEKLKAAGAWEDLTGKISTLSPPPPPPEPPRPVTGTLQFACAPVECEIRLDGGPDKTTKSGKLQISDLPLKEYTVDFRKEGYLPKSQRILATASAQPEIAVTLEIAPETRGRWGAELYKKCLAAIGGAAGLDELKNMSGSGAASSWDTAGTLSEWGIKTTIAGAAYTYELGNASSGALSVSCQGETCGPKSGKWFYGRKKVSGAEGSSLNTNLTQYNRYHLVALLQRIGGENHKLTSHASPAAGVAEHRLLVDSRDETFEITLDGGFLPSTVIYKSKDGLASASITYAQYAGFEKSSKYPKHTSVALPGEKRHGIQVRYETLSGAGK